MLSLRQTGSVAEYIQKFESIVVCITDLSESEALHKFIYGLKSVIKARVLIANPVDINEAMQFAQSLDDVLHPRNPYLRRPAPTYRFGYNRSGAVPMDLDALEELGEEQWELDAIQEGPGKKKGHCYNCG